MTETATAPEQGAETLDFSAEVGRLLDLVVHALYSDREIFLRELVANAADATDRRRIESLTDGALAPPAEAKIRILPDAAARTLTISDSGIGMSRAELIEHLGTIARSGTQAFAAALGSKDAEERTALIGQFGVGFYSAFMVADRVEVVSRRAGVDHAFRWSSDGRGRFEVAPATREEAGSDVVLHLKPDASEFLDAWRIETVVRKWADHVTVPIVILRDGKEVAANEGTALWRKPKGEVSDEQAAEFYRHLGHLFGSPWVRLHWKAEGALEFHAMLFLPEERPLQPTEEERASRVRLHVRRMFITDRADLLPPWLRFVEGVIDTEDLPLNVSREMLQSTPVLARIRKAVTNRVLTELKTRAANPDSGYLRFWENFGAVMKEALWDDHDHQDEVAAIARFRSSAVEGWTSLADYVGRMVAGQEAIYVLAGEDAARLRHAPVLEGFRARGVEVLLLDDAIDAFWPDRLTRFDGKPIRRAAQAGGDLAKLGAADQPPPDGEDIAALTAALRTALGDAVSEVRTSPLLSDSAVMLAAAARGPDLHMQRLLRRSGRGGTLPAPVLEINPRHGLIRALAARAGDAEALAGPARLLLDLARLQEGDAPEDPARFAAAIAAYMEKGLAAAG